ncbi:MAG: ATP-binding protein [Muribaculaceae bacterium]|nr:ATP-binding protein [Muribaculaceae bacterium]
MTQPTGEHMCESTQKSSTETTRTLRRLDGGVFQDVLVGIVETQCEVNGIADPRRFLDPDNEPKPVSCPHCGAPMHHHKIMQEDTFVCWVPIPGPCENPECQRLAAEEKARREHWERVMQFKQDLPRIGIPPEYLDATSKNFMLDGPRANLKKPLKIVTDYANNFAEGHADGKGLYLCGPWGSGKTHMAVIAARGALWHGRKVRFVSSVDLVRELKDSFDHGGTGETMAPYKNATLLVIDDIGKEYASAIVLNMLAEIISTRYAHRRPTVFTSNYMLRTDNPNQMDLQAALMRQGGGLDNAGAILSRIKSRCKVVPVIAPDYREVQGV